MQIGANFDVLLKGLDPQLAADVAKLYAEEAAEEALACERERQIIGDFNANNPAAVRNGMGGIVHRVHATDYWAQQIIHRAPHDPDLWKWFLKTPEGQYARVHHERPAAIVVPEWRGGLWATARAAMAS